MRGPLHAGGSRGIGQAGATDGVRRQEGSGVEAGEASVRPPRH